MGKSKRKYFSPLVDNLPIRVKIDMGNPNREVRDGHLNKEANQIMADSILKWLRDKSRGVGG